MPAQPQPNERYTYEDYMSWETDERWEIIDGVPYMVSAPTWQHQAALMELANQLHNYLKSKGKPCRVFAAPFDVRLFPEDGDDTVVQPDIVVVCDTSRLERTGCKGAPDMVIEILSPSTAAQDNLRKFNIYKRAAVKEYWIADPEGKSVTTYLLKDGEYIARAFWGEQSVPVSILPELQVNLADVFEQE